MAVELLEAGREALVAWEPEAPPPSYREFARGIRLVGGESDGHYWDPSSDPVQSWLIDQLDSGRWSHVFACAPPQIAGKTQVGILLPALRTIVGARRPCGYGLPTLELLDKAWEEKIRPTLVGAGFGAHFPSQGPGSRGGRAPAVTFYDPATGRREGRLVFLAGKALSSTVAVVLVDEVDRLRTADGTPRWEDLQDMFARAGRYGEQALRIAVGTIEEDEPSRSIVLVLVDQQGTGTRVWMGCPHCGRHQRASCDRLVYDASDEQAARESARLVCLHCGSTWDEMARQDALRDLRFVHRGQTVDERGQIQGPEPRTRKLGLLWSALESSIANLGTLAVGHREAQRVLDETGQHGPMRKYWRYMRCEQYQRDQEESTAPAQLDRDWLCKKSAASPIPPMAGERVAEGNSWHLVPTVPEWVRGLSIGVDVQRGGQRAPGRLYWVVRGAGGGRRCLVGYGHWILSPKGREPSAEELRAGLSDLDRWLAKSLRGLPGVVGRGVDVADRMQEILVWLRANPLWTPVRGEDGRRGMKVEHDYTLRGQRRTKQAERRDLDGIGYWRWQEPERGAGWWLLLMPVTPLRRDIQRRLLLPVEHAETYLLPQGLDRTSTVVRHWCATVEVTDGKGGTRWSQGERDRRLHPEVLARKDLLDCAEIAEAVGMMAELRPSPDEPPQNRSAPTPRPQPAAESALPRGGQMDWIA